jgi:hypothetical protein
VSESDSNLIKHAQRELALLGEEPDMVRGYLEMIRVFADMRHSGGSASVFIPTLNALLQYENLTPLTNDPDEWVDQTGISGTPLWQNKRNSKAMSTDGGAHYTLVEDPHQALHMSERVR